MSTVLIKPIITEKMSAQTDKHNRVGFIVATDANKIEIKNAVEKAYNVSVLEVNTMRYAGKTNTRYTKKGITSGRKNNFKKAVVTLKNGEAIDFFSNI
jgi:large subunit ribosomal protein L23